MTAAQSVLFPFDLEPDVERAQAEAAALRVSSGRCPNCDGSGWRYVQEKNGVVRCECRHRRSPVSTAATRRSRRAHVADFKARAAGERE